MVMKVPQKVVWTEGMLVSPQHLQQADAYHERILDSRLAVAAPLPWGIQSVELDLGALGSEQLRIASFAGVLPDGLALSFSAGDPEAPPARPIGAHFPPAQACLDVYVAVPKERDGLPSTAPDPVVKGKPLSADEARRYRYRPVERPVADTTGGAADLNMSFAQRNICILFGDEARDDFEALKIAEIIRNASGALMVNEAYIPSVVTIAASPFLMNGVRRLLALMVAKQRQVSEERRQRDAATVEFAAADVTRFLQLSALNAFIPILVHAARDGEISPRELYLYLIQAAGQMSTLSVEADPSAFPALAFTDLRSTFEELFAILTSLLATSVRQSCVVVPLEIRDGVYVGTLDDERIMRCQQFVLGARANVPEDTVARELPGRTKIASWTQLPFLLRSATRGVNLQVTHRPPQEVPVRPGVAYFVMDTACEHWRQIIVERKVAVYVPPPFDPSQLKIEIFGIPSRG